MLGLGENLFGSQERFFCVKSPVFLEEYKIRCVNKRPAQIFSKNFSRYIFASADNKVIAAPEKKILFHRHHLSVNVETNADALDNFDETGFDLIHNLREVLAVIVT